MSYSFYTNHHGASIYTHPAGLHGQRDTHLVSLSAQHEKGNLLCISPSYSGPWGLSFNHPLALSALNPRETLLCLKLVCHFSKIPRRRYLPLRHVHAYESNESLPLILGFVMVSLLSILQRFHR